MPKNKYQCKYEYTKRTKNKIKYIGKQPIVTISAFNTKIQLQNPSKSPPKQPLKTTNPPITLKTAGPLTQNIKPTPKTPELGRETEAELFNKAMPMPTKI